MAKGYYQTLQQFTRRVGSNMVVGHPEHPDTRGRYMELDDSDHGTRELVQSGHIKPISKRTYRDKTEGTEGAPAGDVRQAQLRGDFPVVSATWSTRRLVEEAGRRKVDLKGETDRRKIIALLNKNKGEGDGEGVGMDTGSGEDPDSFRGTIAMSTNDTTNHPARVSPQNDVQADGGVDRAAIASGVAGEDGEGEELEDDADRAPSGGGGGSGGS